MIADYVMKSIDSLFSEKLSTLSNSQLHKQSSTSHFQSKGNFNKETIKNILPNIIRRDGNSRSPFHTKEKSPSPITKSRLKIILENNRAQKIKSVVKRSSQLRQSSPYHKIEVENNKCRGVRQQGSQFQDISNKENNMIKYYRQQRKSIQKYKAADISLKNAKSRIFGKNTLIARENSASSFH